MCPSYDEARSLCSSSIACAALYCSLPVRPLQSSLCWEETKPSSSYSLPHRYPIVPLPLVVVGLYKLSVFSSDSQESCSGTLVVLHPREGEKREGREGRERRREGEERRG